MHRVTLFIILALLSASAVSRDFDADEGRRLRPVSEDLARALLSEVNTIGRLTAEGQLLHENTLFQRTAGQYCEASWALIEQGELRRGVRAASMALFLGQQSNERGTMAIAKRDLALAFSYAGRLDLAEQYAREALMHTPNYAPVAMVAHKITGDVAMRRGKPDFAVIHYEHALRFSKGGWSRLVQASLANALMATGDLTKAGELLTEASNSGERGVREQVWRARAELALREAKPDDALKQFRELAENARGEDGAYHRLWALEGQSRALLAKGDRAGALAPLLQAVTESEQLRARFRSEEFKTGMFGQLQDIFARAISHLIDAGDPARALDVAEAGRSRALLDQVRGRIKLASGGITLADARKETPSIEAVRALLAPGEAVLAYFVAPERTYVWVVTSVGLRSSVLQIGRSALHADIERLRQSIAKRAPATREIAEKLHAALVAPLDLTGIEKVVIVPHDSLHLLPFHALWTGKGWLAESIAISYAPSAAMLVQLVQRRVSTPTRQLFALGNPDLGNPLLALPGAEREVQEIRKLYPDAKILVRGEASKPAFLKDAPRYSVLHVAAHAQFDDLDPLYSRIRLAPSEESSGVLEAHEIYSINLRNSSIVTLSACESGLSRVTNGDEIWGFSRAFLTAGAPSLLVSLWAVSDEATEVLMRRFYEGLRAKDARDALREAQLAVLHDKRFAHPFFWSAFSLVGDWR